MIQYINEEEYITSFTPAKGVVVIDVNCQGIMETTKHQELFKTSFPNTYREYMKLVADRSLTPGEVLWFEEDTYKIALLVTQTNLVGHETDEDEDVCTYTDLALEELICTATENDTTFLCPLINKNNVVAQRHFHSAATKLGKTFDWCVYVR